MQNEIEPADRAAPEERRQASPAKYVAIAIIGVAFAIGFAVIAYKWSPGEIAKGLSTAAGTGLDKIVDGGARVVRGAERRASRLAAAFLAENIQHTFSDHITSIEAEKKGRLLVATIQAEERMSSRSIRPWGTTTVTVTVPATYHYSVSLREKWGMRTEESPGYAICRVICPDIRPILPVAFDTLRTETEVTTTWLRRDGEEQKSELERDITPTLMRRSGQRIPQARTVAKGAISDFIRSWLTARGQWGEGKFQYVIVNFPDEVDPDGKPLQPELPRPGR